MAENVGTVENTEVKCYLVKLEDGWHVEHLDGTYSDVCKFDKTGEWIALPENDANRKWMALGKAEKEVEANGKIPLTFKASRTLGTRTTKVPNESLVKTYLSQEEQDEYFAIIARAKAAYDADHVKAAPATELEKAEAALKKAQAKYEAALAKIQAKAADEGGNN